MSDDSMVSGGVLYSARSAMAHTQDVFSILLVDDDDLLIADALGLNHAGVAFVHAVADPAFAGLEASRADMVVLSLDLSGGFERLAALVAAHGAPPVIAIAARGQSGASLEHTLLRAELRGAAQSLPKPIDAVELAFAALELAARRAPRNDAMQSLVQDFERRLVS